MLACGPVPPPDGSSGGGVVYAVAVAQPVQSWTVLRSHEDFIAVGDVLSQTAGVSGIPKCPPLQEGLASPAAAAAAGGSDSSLIVEARNGVQDWLSSVLMYPSARETQAFRNFLTMGANTILPQYEGVTWTQFAGAMMVPAGAAPAVAAAHPPHHLHHHPGNHHQHHQTSAAAAVVSGAGSPSLRSGPVDDMEMDDMFLEDDGGGGAGGMVGGMMHPHHHSGSNGGDDREDGDDDEFNENDIIPSAAERYKPTDEAVTDQEELEFLQECDVEMIEDIGSLAQSLGASHLGRSLNLQAEMKSYSNSKLGGLHQQSKQQPVQGLNIGGGGSSSSPSKQGSGGSGGSGLQMAVGGIGGAMAQAAQAAANVNGACNNHNTNTSFNRRALESSPRLDSFKMIRVIGKGSFGTFYHVCEDTCTPPMLVLQRR